MTLKHFLLGSAAGLMVATGAQAADLGTEAPPAAVDYVKVCDAFGAGFFYIPGTETCLDISGRVRFTTRYIANSEDLTDADDQFRWTADARVDFDARTATEFGTLRSFFRVQSTSDDTANVEVDSAFIQLGYLTVGYAGTPLSVDVLYGISDQTYFDYQTLQGSVLVDDLGGGFYAGIGVVDNAGGRLDAVYGDDGDGVDQPDDDFNGTVVGRLGIADQPWGGVELAGGVVIDGQQSPARFVGGLPAGGALALGLVDDGGSLLSVDNSWFVKATANLTLVDAVSARLVAAYSGHDAVPYLLGGTLFDPGSVDILTLAGAVSYAATESTSLYAGLRYDNVDIDAAASDLDIINANLGVDYTVAPGLIATGEFNYTRLETDGDDADAFAVIGRLTRNW